MSHSTLVIEKAIDRVRKLLALAQNTTEHEAALAASRAAKLVEQFELTEAMIRIDDTAAKAEPIECAGRLQPELSQFGGRASGRKRVAWKETLAKATGSDLGIKVYWRNNVDITGFGRESAIQTWRYVFQYLVRIVDELADLGWAKHGSRDDSQRAWKNAFRTFRTGCAQRVATRMWEERQARTTARDEHKRMMAHTVEGDNDEATVEDALHASRECQALAIVAKDQAEVDEEYATYSKSWGRPISSIGKVSSYDGYTAGSKAGASIKLGGGGKALPAGQGRLK